MIGAAIRTASGRGGSEPGSRKGLSVRLLIGLLASIATFALPGAPAQAGTGISHPHLFSIDPTTSVPDVDHTVQGIALNEADERLYVVVSRSREPVKGILSDSVVRVFDSATGAFLSQLDLSQSPATLTNFPWRFVDIAVDNSGGPSNGRIYISSCDEIGGSGSSPDSSYCLPNSNSIIEVFAPSGTYIGQVDGSETVDGPYPAAGGGIGISLVDTIAVDGSGDLYVARPDKSSAVDKFDSSGKFVAGISKPQFNLPQSLAFDSAGGYYAANSNCQAINRFNSAGVFQGALGGAGSRALAVDTSSDDLYVAGSLFLSQYDSAGTLLGYFGGNRFEDANPKGFVKGSIPSSFCGQPLAIDSSTGRIYAAAKGGEDGVEVLGPGVPATTPDVTTEPATDIGYHTVTLHGKVNPNGEPTSYRFKYDGTTVNVHRVTPLQNAGAGSGEVAVSAEVTLATPLTHNSEFSYRLIGVNTDDETVSVSDAATFKTLQLPPPTLDPPTKVTSTTVHVSGSFNPQGLETTWELLLNGQRFKLQDAPAGMSDVPVSADLTGLEPNTEYELVLTTRNGGGGSLASLDFTTAAEKPVAITIPAGCLQAISACIGAGIDPRKSQTDYYLEYGLDETYGTTLPATKDGDAGAALGVSKHTAQLDGLEPDTVYHYRVVAENQAGKVTSPDATFKTRPSTSPFGPSWPARGFELVSLPDKGNQPAARPAGATAYLSPGADRVLWTTYAGAPGANTGAEVPYLSIREGESWSTETLAPSASQQPLEGRGSYRAFYASLDLSSFVLWQKSDGEPSALLWVDDSGNQVQLGPLIPDGFLIHPGGGVMATTGSRNAFLPNPDGSDSVVEFTEGVAKEIVGPACGYENRSFSFSSSYRWLAPQGRVLFVNSAGDGPCNAPLGVYRLDAESDSVELISGAQSTAARFEAANADGSAAIYAKDGEIYRWEKGAGSTCLTCVTGGTSVSQASLLISADLERIYFISPKRLVGGEGIAYPSCAGDGSPCNAYLWKDGEISFVGTERLSTLSANALAGRGRNPSVVATADSSASGDTIAFLSSDPLTSADPTGGLTQLYRYEIDTGRVECVSCNGTSEPTEGTLEHPTENKPTPFAISGDGNTVAFATTAPLVHRDVNGTRDVYEWHEGFVRLVTDGVSEIPDTSIGYPEVWGIGDDGRNLIFHQRGRLVGNESDALQNLYNARLGGGTVLPEPPAPCVEDACQGPLEAPPALSNPGSSAFSGPVNERPVVKKKTRKKKSKAQAKKAKQKKKQRQRAKRANGNRGGAK